MQSRTPPQNLEAEQSILGSILIDNGVFANIEGILTDKHFYKEGHRKIYRSFSKLFQRHEPIDLVTVTEELRQSGDLEAIGSVAYLIGLADGVPTAAYAENYAQIVAQKAILRDLISASGEIMQAAYDQALPLEQILDKAETNIFELTSNKRKTYFEAMSSLVNQTFTHIQELLDNPDPISGLRTGFKELDSMTAGLQPGSLNILAARPSMGKCLGKGTNILMYNGSLKAVEDINIGDKLMGDDSKPRTVLSLARGREEMYWVRQNKGIDYRVNKSHILSLKRSRNEGRHKNGDILNIELSEYLDKSDKFKSNYKGYKVAVDFPNQKLEIEPYFLGIWLGDGRSSDVRIATQDKEIVSYIKSYASRLSLQVNSYFAEDKCPMYGITRGHTGGNYNNDTSLQKKLRAYNLLNNKHIPQIYLSNNKENRMQLLAGLLDSDGHYDDKHHVMEITQKNKHLARQIKLLADSLGFRASFRAKKAQIASIGYVTEVYRIRIVGELDKIPTKIPRKQARTLASNRNHQHTGISIEYDKVDDYYGFEIDGNRLFLLEDMTVTHNTAMALNMAQHVALREKKTVGVFSLEMSGVQLVTRMLCSEARVDMSRVANGQLSERDFQRLANTAGEMTEAQIFIDDKSSLTIMELRSRARRLMAEHDLGLIIIDYLQLMEGSSDNRQQEISTISRGLKALARELDIPVLVLSQLSRAVESRPNKRPMLSDLRESGAIEQDADLVMFVYRDEYYDPQSERQGIAEIIIGKQRNGPVGKVELQFHNAHVRFNDLAKTSP